MTAAADKSADGSAGTNSGADGSTGGADGPAKTKRGRQVVKYGAVGRRSYLQACKCRIG